MDLAASLSIFTCVPLKLRDVSATLVTSEARRSNSAPMSAVVDVLISSASSVGSSEDLPAFLFFARGASTAGVFSSSIVSSVHRLLAFSEEQKNHFLKRTAFLIFLVLTCVGSIVNSASAPPLMLLSASLSSPTVVSFFPIGRAKWPLVSTLVTTTSHYHFQMARATRFRHACQYGCSFPGSSCSSTVVTHSNMASSPP